MSEWDYQPLSQQLQSIESGSRPKGGIAKYTSGVPSLSAEQLREDGSFNFDTVRYVPREFFITAKKGRLRKGDVLVVKDGATTGKTGFVGEDFPFSETMVNEHTFILRTKPTFLPKFAFLCLHSEMAADCFATAREHGLIGGLTQNFPEDIEVPVPPLVEQRRIVERVETLTRHLDQVRQTRQTALAEAETVFQRALENTFSNEVMGEWRELPAEQLFKIVSGQFSPLDPKLKHLPYLGPEHVEGGTGRIIGERRSVEDLRMTSGKYHFTPEHVVYSKIRPALRKVCLPNYTGLCSADMYALKPNTDEVTREFLMFLLLAPPFSQYAMDNSDRNAMPKINREVLFGFAFRVPAKRKQACTARLLLNLRGKLDELQRLQREVESDLAAFTPALLAKAFRGKL